MTHPNLYLLISLSILLLSVSANDFFVLKGTNLNLESIDQNNVADLISHVSGFPVINEEVDRTNFPKIDLFSLPKANLLVAVDGLTRDLISPIESELKFFKLQGAIPINRDIYHDDSLSLLTSIATGESSDTHGIIGRSWRANKAVSVTAFSSNGQCQVPKIADYVSNASNGQARTLVFSGEKSMALALGVHPELDVQNKDQNNEILYFSKYGVVDFINDETVYTTQQARSAAKQKMIGLQSTAGNLFAAELFAIENIHNRLAAMPGGETNVADFIGISVASIKSLAIQYGDNSEQVLSAVRFLDSSLFELSNNLNELYDNQVVTEFIGIERTEDFTTKSQTARNVVGVIEGGYSSFEVQQFQTSIWVAMVFAIIVIGALYTLVKMDMLYDSIVYKTTDGPKPIQNVK